MAEEKLNLQITIDTAAGTENVDKLNNKTKETAKSAKEGQGAFSSLGNTIKSLGIISVIAGAFNFFKETLSKNQKVADSVAAVFNTIATIVNKLVDIFIDVTDAVGKNTNGFDALGKVMTGLLTLAITPLKNSRRRLFLLKIFLISTIIRSSSKLQRIVSVCGLSIYLSVNSSVLSSCQV